MNAFRLSLDRTDRVKAIRMGKVPVLDGLRIAEFTYLFLLNVYTSDLPIAV